MKTALWVALVAWSPLIGFSAGVHYERRGHEEYLRLTSCGSEHSRFSWCVPNGCAVDLATYPPSWHCGARTWPEVKP